MTDRVGHRVLLLTKGLDVGGVERMVVSLGAGLSVRGLDVEVGIINGDRNGLQDEIDASGLTQHRLRGTDRIGLRGLADVFRLLRSGRYDIVHAHGPLPAVLARCLAGSTPVVSTSHTPFELLHRLTRMAWRMTCWRDSGAVAVSSSVAQSLPGGGTRSLRVIPHGVSQLPPSVHKTAHRAEDSVIAIAVASHRPVKNYPNLIDALVIARAGGLDIRLVALGDGVDLDVNRRYAAAVGLESSISFELPNPDVLRRIADADMLVVSSDDEGQPLVVAEALSVGTPVVATDVGRVSDLVGPDVGRVVPIGQPVALAAAIVELARDAELRRRMGAAAIVQSARWTLADAIEAHLDLYAPILG